MHFRDGTSGQKVLFFALLGVYALGVLIAAGDKLQRVGQPDVGFILDGANASPTRLDVAKAGMRGGGRAIEINGLPLAGHSLSRDIEPRISRVLGESNTVVLQRPIGAVEHLTLEVRPWTWADAAFAEGPTAGLGALLVVVGISSFLLRPYGPSGWALLALCSVAAGLMTNLFTQSGPTEVFEALYFRTMVGLISAVTVHAALAFPVVHPVLIRRPHILWLVYGVGLAIALYGATGWIVDWVGPFAIGGAVDATALLGAILFFGGRCSVAALRTRDPLVAQRARILLIGALFGVAPLVSANFLRNTMGVVIVDMQVTYWSFSLFVLALGYITVRQDLLNARIAVRRAVMYSLTVLVLTSLAIVLVAVRPYAVALLLLPLLYLWPRFDARLNARLYPQRVRFPELVRAIGGEMAACTSIEALLDVLLQAPARLCDTRGSQAFLFAGVAGPGARLQATDPAVATDAGTVTDEPLIQLMITTRKEISRDHIAVEPQYSNIQHECYAGFDRLRANVLLPMLQDTRVIGGLALGPRATGDAYEGPELDALATLIQQAVQAIVRIEATERLRAREIEFAELKRFFPPQVIDQVMARGGAAELRTQRKLVTVFFADLRGFTAFSDRVEPEEVMATLAEYHAAMGQRIAEFAGTLERFVGDGFMVFFNDPVEQPDHVDRAVHMALAMHADAGRLRQEWIRKGYAIDVGMGIHTGYATCGFIGYEGRRDYGVIGNVTNLAARLSDAAGRGEILVSGRVQAELRNGVRTESAGELQLKGFQQPQAVFRLLPSDGSLPADSIVT